MSSRLLLPLVTAADALLAVIVGVALPLLCTTAIWLANGITGDWGVAFAAAVGAWALSLGGDLVVTLGPDLLGALGLTDPISFEIGLAPLGLTLATIVLALRSGARLRTDEMPLAVGLTGPLVFGIATWGLCSLASHAMVAIDGLGTGILGALIYLVAVAVGARVWELIPEAALADQTAGWGRDGITAMARGIGLMLAGLVGLGALGFLVASVLGLARILTVYQALHFDVVGAISLGLGQLALIPNAIAWTISWMLGPGFLIGDGSSVSPLATTLGPLPSVPILGALPEGIPPVAIVLVVLPVALGVFAGLAMRLAPGADEWNTGWRRVLTPLVASSLAAIAIALFGLMAGGAIGPGRLAVTGPAVGWMLLCAFATLAIGSLTGAFVPLADLEAAPASDESVTSGRAGAVRIGARSPGSGRRSSGRGGSTGETRYRGGHDGGGRDGDGRDGGNRDDAGHDHGYADDAYDGDAGIGDSGIGDSGIGDAGIGDGYDDDADFEDDDIYRDLDEDRYTHDDLDGRDGTGAGGSDAEHSDAEHSDAEHSDADDPDVVRRNADRRNAETGVDDGRSVGSESRSSRGRGQKLPGRGFGRFGRAERTPTPARGGPESSSARGRTPREDDEPDIYAGIDPLTDD